MRKLCVKAQVRWKIAHIDPETLQKLCLSTKSGELLVFYAVIKKQVLIHIKTALFYVEMIWGKGGFNVVSIITFNLVFHKYFLISRSTCKVIYISCFIKLALYSLGERKGTLCHNLYLSKKTTKSFTNN